MSEDEDEFYPAFSICPVCNEEVLDDEIGTCDCCGNNMCINCMEN